MKDTDAKTWVVWMVGGAISVLLTMNGALIWNLVGTIETTSDRVWGLSQKVAVIESRLDEMHSTLKRTKEK
jgi:hypothetical protein